MDPLNTIVSVKRLMGRGLADVKQLGEQLPYRFSSESESQMPYIETVQGPKSPVQVSADILTALRQRAEATLGGELVGAVITVPAYFDDAQRQATKDAARLAGLSVLRLLNEPTAAAVAYGLDRQAEGVVAIYDLGGGTFDISILRLTKGVFEVLATGGDTALGGDDFDHAVAGWILGQPRVPSVRSAVAGLFGREPLTDIDPDEVVAIGAAIQAETLAGNNRGGEELLLLDVIPLSLGLETMGGLMEKIIPRNTTIPVARAQDFTTYKDGQSAMMIHVLQGERELIADCRSLARFELRGIPSMVAGAAKIRVTFQVDADGLLSVSARELASGVEASIQVKPSYGLTDGEIARMLEDSFRKADEDRQARALREQLVDAQRLLEAVEAALAADGERLLSVEEREAIEVQMSELRGLLDSQDVIAVERQIKRLSQITDAFAARRLDSTVKAALAGRRLNDIED